MEQGEEREMTSTTPEPGQTTPATPATNPAATTTPPRRLPIKTYHCRFCSHLLIASTRDFFSSLRTQPYIADRHPQPDRKPDDDDDVPEDDALPRRKAPGLDNAFIVPLPSRKQLTRNSSDINAASEQGQGQDHLTILLATTIPDSKPIIVRRAADDGFEKRRRVRCGRCRVVVGYFIERDGPLSGTSRDVRGKKNKKSTRDYDHDGLGHSEGATEAAVEEDEEDEEDDDDDDDETKIVYILPGSLISTEDMVGVGGGDILQEVMKKGTTDEDKNTNAVVLAALEREWKGWIADTA